MSGLFNAIGFFSGVLGIVSFLQDNAPEATEAKGATVRVKAGLNDGGEGSPESLGGLVWVRGYNANNMFQGQSDTAQIGAGGVADLTIDDPVPGQRTEYLNILNGDDATCIAWITLTQYDGTNGIAWTGDVGKSCNQPWFPNNEFAGYLDDGSEYFPSCMWLDGDHTNDIPFSSMKFTVRAFSQGDKDGSNGITDTLARSATCDALYFRDNGEVNDEIPNYNVAQKRSTWVRKPWMEQQLIVSQNITAHSAHDVCGSETSYGPDFVGSDGYYCDMESHTLTPLCSTENVDGCLDIDHTAKTVVKRTTVSRRDATIAHKTYKKVITW